MASRNALLPLLVLLGCSTSVLGTTVTAIWEFSGLPSLSDAQVNEVITKVVNPLTDVSWENPVLSGSFDYMCTKKLNISCVSQYPLPSSSSSGASPSSPSSSSSTSSGSSSASPATASPRPSNLPSVLPPGSEVTGVVVSEGGASPVPATPAGNPPAGTSDADLGADYDYYPPPPSRTPSPPAAPAKTPAVAPPPSPSPSPPAATPSPPPKLPASPPPAPPTATRPSPSPAASASPPLLNASAASPPPASKSPPVGNMGKQRRLLQSSSIFLKLDVTDTSLMWTQSDIDSIVTAVSSSMETGEFKELLAKTTVRPNDVALRYIDVSTSSMPTASTPSSSPSTATGSSPGMELFPNPGTPAAKPSPPSSNNVSTGGGSNKTTIIIVISCVVGALALSVGVCACVAWRKKTAKARVEAALMVHRWKQERDAVSLTRAKLQGASSGRSPQDRSKSLSTARSMGGKDIDPAALKTYHTTKPSTWRSMLGLGGGSSSEGAGSQPQRAASAPARAQPGTGPSVHVEIEASGTPRAPQGRNSLPQQPAGTQEGRGRLLSLFSYGRK